MPRLPRVQSRQKALRAVELWQKGLTVRQIALRLDRPFSAINGILSKRGLLNELTPRTIPVDGGAATAGEGRQRRTWIKRDVDFKSDRACGDEY